MQADFAAYRQRHGASGATAGPAGQPAYTFYPMGGTLNRDLDVFNYNDLDPTAGILDFACSDWTYNGHEATDTTLRSFGEQLLGVPVFAALDGTVFSAHDGEEDMNTVWAGQPANYVAIDHGNGRHAYYYHFKKWSVAVAVDDVVRAGQQIGLTGSSGVSTWPHLHFATYDNFAPYEPYAGTCRPGPSGWENQIPKPNVVELLDAGVTYENVGSYVPPYEFPRSGQIAVTDSTVYFWVFGRVLPPGSNYRIRFQSPDAKLAHDSGVNGFGNPFYRWWWWWWGYDTGFLGMNSVLGTWHILLDLNGQRVADLPVEVRPERTPDFNRPPESITVSLAPSQPTESDVIMCRVGTDLVLDDLDYEIVRYEYVWTVNGDEVRHVTTAGHADALPHYTASLGDTVECAVTPRDAVAAGASASASAQVLVAGPTGDPGQADKNRSVSLSVPAASATAGPGPLTALRVALIELQNPQPPNIPCCPPPDFSSYEFGPSCSDPGGCVRWVGLPSNYLESQDIPASGSFRAARLQCTPLYYDWTSEGLVHVVGAEIVPSSTYHVHILDASCVGNENDCTMVSHPLVAKTARSGDVEAPFNPPSTSTQPDVTDVAQLVNKFKSLPGALAKAIAQLQPNLPELNGDINALDILAVVDAVKQKAYPFGGPCPCLSTVTCGSTPCTSPTPCVAAFGAEATCVKTCAGGDNDGDPCINDTHGHCPGGTCGTGFCRDRCGRCSP